MINKRLCQAGDDICPVANTCYARLSLAWLKFSVEYPLAASVMQAAATNLNLFLRSYSNIENDLTPPRLQL